MMHSVDYIFAFLMGIFGSLHCVGMCGGLISAFFIKVGDQGGLFAYISYHAGRTSIYVLLGIVAAVLGMSIERVDLFGSVQGMVQVTAGVVITIIGMEMLGFLPWNFSLECLPIPSTANLFKKATQKGPIVGAFMAGSLNGFIPCNLLYTMGIKAASTGDPLQGGLLMGAFAMGTLPAMLFISLAFGKMKDRVRKSITKLAAMAVVAMGGMTIYRGILALIAD